MFGINIFLCKWLIFAVTLLWSCKILIRKVWGVNITWINLFKLEICGFSLEDGSIKIKSVRFALRERKLLIKGLRIVSSQTIHTNDFNEELPNDKEGALPETSRNFGYFFTSRIPSFIQYWLNGIAIILEDTEIVNNDITIEKFGFFVSINKSKRAKSLRFDSFLRKLLWNDQIIIADAIFIVNTNLLIGDILNSLKDDLQFDLDLKLGDLNVPMNLLNLFLNKENIDIMSNKKLLQRVMDTTKACLLYTSRCV